MFNSNNSKGKAETGDVGGGEGRRAAGGGGRGGGEEEEGGGEEGKRRRGEGRRRRRRRRRGARQKYASAEVRIKNIRERKRKRSLPIKAIGQIATSSNVQVT